MNIIKYIPVRLWLIFTTTFICAIPAYNAQQVILLYKGKIPNSRNVTNEEYWNASHTIAYKILEPTLTIFLPPKGK
jgi:hypothetical protein